MIHIDLGWVHKMRLNNRIKELLLHEEYHNMGLGHCPDKKCLMYYQYQIDLVFGAKKKELCGTCRPNNVNDWLSGVIK
ncbi:hypothetical protein KAR91_45275, partial [Candidatus Pacearchaeota archaeon]|nr:hypothetical protein [Candidatus Pacearchaeota archaeon]